MISFFLFPFMITLSLLGILIGVLVGKFAFR